MLFHIFAKMWGKSDVTRVRNPRPEIGPQCQVSGQMSGKMRYSLQTWPRRAARAGGPPRVPGGPPGAKTAGATPTTGCVTPPGGVGVERRREIYPRRAPSLRFGGAPAERGENPPISARGTNGQFWTLST